LKAQPPPVVLMLAGRQAVEPAVSVIIATHNRAAMLEEAVAACASQQPAGELEVIVVDDLSNDGTERLMRRLVEEASVPVVYLRLGRRSGPAGSRNAGLEAARGRFVAFTDDDCLPSPRWLAEALAAFTSPGIGMVQGRTVPLEKPRRIYARWVETSQLDGTFATANMVYRREALATDNFDPGCPWWEDTDLGWRLVENGWEAAFAPEALVRHRIIPQTMMDWVLWTRRYQLWCANAARHPGLRKHLFLGVWIRPLHLAAEVALVGLAAGWRRRPALALALPYLVAFVLVHNVRSPNLAEKALAYLARDLVGIASVVAGSARHRTVVL